MRTLIFILVSAFVVTLAFWAYRENYETQTAMKEAQSLQRQIAAAHERLRVLNAEWAYLNRPERLRELINMNFSRLELMPLEASQFSSINTIPYPPQALAVFDPATEQAEVAQ